MMKVILIGFPSLLANFGNSQETGEGQIYLPTEKKKVTWENEWNMFDIFIVVSEKILQEPKEIICKWCCFQSLAISKYRGGNKKIR